MARRALSFRRANLRDGAFLLIFLLALCLSVRAIAKEVPSLSVFELSLGILLSTLFGWLFSDLASGLIHFIADNWGSPSTPVFGTLLIAPFREHHTTPASILDHGFLERNANNALISLPLVIWIPWTPLQSPWLVLGAASATQMAMWAALTNEIHASAHAQSAAPGVRRLQEWGLVLSPDRHLAHHQIVTSHQNPRGFHYCITSGACDRLALAIGSTLWATGRALSTIARVR